MADIKKRELPVDLNHIGNLNTISDITGQKSFEGVIDLNTNIFNQPEGYNSSIVDLKNNYPIPVQYDPNTGEDLGNIPRIIVTPKNTIPIEDRTSAGYLDALLGAGGQERFQLWPERMVRSALSAAGEVVEGKLPVDRDPITGKYYSEIDYEPNWIAKNIFGSGNFRGPAPGSVIERAQDVTGMAGMSSIPLATKGALGAIGGKFYSTVEKTLENSKVQKATPDEWMAYLKNQPGVKPEELEFSLGGLPQKQLTKAEVQSHIAENGIKLEEVWKGKQDNLIQEVEGLKLENEKLKQEHDKLKQKGLSGNDRGLEIYDLMNENHDRIRELEKNNFQDTKYSSYQLPGGPLSKDTEILTRNGWKRIDCVSIGEEIITRKDNDGELEWKPVQAIPVVYAEKLYHFFSQSIDMQVTANHKMVVKKRRRNLNKNLYRITAQQLWQTSECIIPLTGNWLGNGAGDIFGMNAEDVAEFIGWYLAEGSYKHKNGTKNTIQIAQCRITNPEKCDILEALFDRLGLSWTYYGAAYGVGIKSMNKDLMQLLHNQPTSEGKYVPKFLFNQSQKVIHALLRGLILGDGCITKTEHQDRYMFFSKSKQLADDVQILILLAGNRASVRQRASGLWAVGINRKEWCSVDDAKHSIVDYNDFAYCVTVENHCIYVRRNGVAAFTGNSDYRELLLTIPEKQISKEAAAKQFYETFGRKGGGPTWEELNPAIKKNYLDDVKPYMQSDTVSNYKSSHWDEPNVLAHIRMNDREVPGVGYAVQNTKSGNTSNVFFKREDAQKYYDNLPEGMKKDIHGNDKLSIVEAPAKLKTLHIEEIQSDWHQAGRKGGYKEDLEGNITKEYEAAKARGDVQGMKEANDKHRILLESDLIAQNSMRPPNAPFKKTWDELALKRVLTQAVQEGKDAVSWTPGEAQALRYQNDIRQKINNVDWHNKNMGKVNENGQKQILVEGANGSEINIVIDKNGMVTGGHGELVGKPLERVLGKDIAKKILEKDEGNFDAKGYVMDSEGMKAFYDKMLVDKANALVKKMGGKVEYFDIPDTIKKTLTGFGPDIPGTKQIPLIRITPQMREKIQEGFPLYSSGIPVFSEVDNIPEKKQPKLVPVDRIPKLTPVPYIPGQVI